MRYYTVFLLLLIASCVSEPKIDSHLEGRSILGEWRFHEHAYSPGNSQVHRSPILEEKGLILNANGQLLSHSFLQCNEGQFTVSDDTLTISFECKEELPERRFSLSWEKDKLVMTPLSPLCFEYCAFIFIKSSMLQ
jgi:hypothetical protein